VLKNIEDIKEAIRN